METNRVQYIDAFRGLAVLSVVLFHYTDRVPYEVLNYNFPILPGAWSWGWIGPYWFFIISGYFMSASIGKSSDIVAFLAKRVSRIYPAYFVAILLILTYMWLVPPVTYEPWHYSSATPPLPDIIANFFFLTDLGFEHVDGAFWTLGVELKYYLYLSIIYFLVASRNIDKTIRIVTFAAGVLGILWLIVNLYISWQPASLASLDIVNSVLQTIFISLDLPFFALGMLAHRAIKLRKSELLIAPGAMLVLCIAVVGLLSTTKPYAYENIYLTVSVFSFVAIGFFLLLYSEKISNAATHVPSFLVNAFVRIGVVSYAWYLVHQDMGVTTIYHLNTVLPGPVSLVIVLAGTYALGELLSLAVEWRFRPFVERTFNQVGRALFPRLVTHQAS